MVNNAGKENLTVFTIGHSTRSTGDFLNILQSYGIKVLADVRTLPGSRHNPQFNREALEKSLKEAGIAYVHMPGLGGLRKSRKDSPNKGFRNDSFRGYADYMMTDEFEENIGRLISLARSQTAAIMCAEAVPWRCHRSLIGDGLVVRGLRVIDIIDGKEAIPHNLTDWAEVTGTRITYP